MRLQFFIQDFNLHPDKLLALRKHRLILMDSSIFLCTFYEACYRERLSPVLLLFTEWGRKTLSEVPYIPDFIELEAINTERFHYKNRKVRRFLRNVHANKLEFYIELKTPIKHIKAENRSTYLDLLPKSVRHTIIKNYGELSGTDMAILVTALFLTDHHVRTAIASVDRTLLQAANELGIATCEAETLCKELTEAMGEPQTT
jgi:hypothetical protein